MTAVATAQCFTPADYLPKLSSPRSRLHDLWVLREQKQHPSQRGNWFRGQLQNTHPYVKVHPHWRTLLIPLPGCQWQWLSLSTLRLCWIMAHFIVNLDIRFSKWWYGNPESKVVGRPSAFPNSAKTSLQSLYIATLANITRQTTFLVATHPNDLISSATSHHLPPAAGSSWIE